VLAYHQGSPRKQSRLAVDVGTGHGLVARELSAHFDRVIGSDPSAGMVMQAQKLSGHYSNVEFYQAPAESLPVVKGQEVDLVTAAQSSHWFDYPKLWPELARIVRPGGSLAFWGYKDHVLVSYPKASEIIQHYAYDDSQLGSYWQQPGRGIVQDKLRAVIPPTSDWGEVQRVEYEPETNGPASGWGTRFMNATMTLGAMEEYIRTWSSLHKWQQKFADRSRRGPNGEGRGDIVDEMMDAVRDAEPGLRGDGEGHWKEIKVDVEWGSALILARRLS
jgi:trans-aconitate 3-methyltransferase